MPDKGGEGDPAGGVHMDMLLVRDVLLVHYVDVNSLLRVLSPQNVVETLLEVFAVTAQILPRIFPE